MLGLNVLQVHCCSAAHVLAHIYSLNLNQDEIITKWNLVERRKINENGRKRAIEKVYWIQLADFDLKAFSFVIDVNWGLK